MPLLLGQLVYTSFAGMGFKTVASAQVPTEIQQAFQLLTCQHWDSYTPPESRYRAVYLHQVTPEHNLFGWLYNDGADDVGRPHVPYFHCYYLAQPLHAIQLENIFTCLHKGPVALIERDNLPETLETIVVRNFWSYQPVRTGVTIPLDVRKRSHIALKQGELLDLFLPVAEQEMVNELTALNSNHQKLDLSIYTNYLVEVTETGAVAVNEDAVAMETGAVAANENAAAKLQPISDRTLGSLKHLEQVLQVEKFVEAIKRAFLKFVE